MSKVIPTIVERRKQSHDQLVADILLIAREMMQADGVAALSFNGIARRLGIKPPSLYTYFESKHAIYDALFRLGFESFTRQMEEQVDRTKGLPAFLRTMAAGYMNFALENPDLYQLMFQRPVPGFTPSEESMAVSLHSLHRLHEELAAMMAKLHMASDPTLERSRDLFLATVHGLTEFQLANDPDAPVGEGRFGRLVDEAVQLFIQAWSTTEDTPSSH